MNFMKNLEPLRVELRSKSALLLNTMSPPPLPVLGQETVVASLKLNSPLFYLSCHPVLYVMVKF